MKTPHHLTKLFALAATVLTLWTCPSAMASFKKATLAQGKPLILTVTNLHTTFPEAYEDSPIAVTATYIDSRGRVEAVMVTTQTVASAQYTIDVPKDAVRIIINFEFEQDVYAAMEYTLQQGNTVSSGYRIMDDYRVVYDVR